MTAGAYSNPNQLASYKKVVNQVLPAFSSGNLANDVVALEKNIADATENHGNYGYADSHNYMSLKEIESLLPQIHYGDIISHFAPSDYHPHRLVVGSPSYLEALSSILCNTSRETVIAFFKWRLIEVYAPDVMDSKVQPLQEYIQSGLLLNKDAPEERSMTCTTGLKNRSDLGWILSRFYVMKYFPPSSKELGTTMVTNLKERFETVLSETSWMKPDERKEGIQKVKNIDVQIGYPVVNPNVTDASSVEQYYSDIEITDDYFANEVSASKADVNRQWSLLGKPPLGSNWDIMPVQINNAFFPIQLYILSTAAVMQPPVFYEPTAPGYLNYGLYGASAGHEITHGESFPSLCTIF